MTYRIQMQGEARRLAREHDARMDMAWHSAALTRAKEFPSHAKFTGRKPKVRRMSAEEFRAAFRQIREGAKGG